MTDQAPELLREAIAKIIVGDIYDGANVGRAHQRIRERGLCKADEILALTTARPSDAAVAWPSRDAIAKIIEDNIYRKPNGNWDGDFQDLLVAADEIRALPPDEPARVTPSTVGMEDIACEYSGVFGSPPRVCVNKDQCHRVGQCYYKKSPSQPAQDGRLKRCPHHRE